MSLLTTPTGTYVDILTDRYSLVYLESGDDTDYSDCGDGLDVIVDYDPSKGDTHTNNCEDIRERL
jgi:hypothetical protein